MWLLYWTTQLLDVLRHESQMPGWMNGVGVP